MEIKDLAGLSAPLTKLIEVISAGVGQVSESYFIKNRAKAKAEEITLISSALHQASQEKGLPIEYKSEGISIWRKPEDGTFDIQDTTIQQRSNSRLEYQERKHQDNLEKITSAAAAELVHETTVPGDEINEDWISRFFESAQSISSEEMQDLWGRILAGEIKKPGSYSLKALDLIRNLSKSDASLIEEMGKFSLFSNHGPFIATCDTKWLKKERNIYPNHHFKLAELGLLYPSDLSLMSFDNDDKQVVYQNGNHVLLIKKYRIKEPVYLPVWKYTAIGKELVGLVPDNYDQEYFVKIGQYFLNKGAKVSIIEDNGDSFNDISRYKTILKIDDSM